jgi:hypothetical protein
MAISPKTYTPRASRFRFRTPKVASAWSGIISDAVKCHLTFETLFNLLSITAHLTLPKALLLGNIPDALLQLFWTSSCTHHFIFLLPVNASSDETGNRLACHSDRQAITSAVAPETLEHRFAKRRPKRIGGKASYTKVPNLWTAAFHLIISHYFFGNPQIASNPFRTGRENNEHLSKNFPSRNEMFCALETCMSFTCASRIKDLHMHYYNIKKFETRSRFA